MTALFSELQFWHWTIVVGAVLVGVGFIGYALHQNRSTHDRLNAKGE